MTTGHCQIPASMIGRIPAGLLRLLSNLAGSRPFWPDPAVSVAGSDQIKPDSGHFGQIRSDQWPNPVRSYQIPAILARSSRINGRDQSYPAGSVAGSGQIRPVSDYGRITARFCWNLVRRHPTTVAGCRRIPESTLFRRLDDAGFGQSDIKRACNDK
jgi:hypothetical protein